MSTAISRAPRIAPLLAAILSLAVASCAIDPGIRLEHQYRSGLVEDSQLAFFAEDAAAVTTRQALRLKGPVESTTVELMHASESTPGSPLRSALRWHLKLDEHGMAKSWYIESFTDKDEKLSLTWEHTYGRADRPELPTLSTLHATSDAIRGDKPIEIARDYDERGQLIRVRTGLGETSREHRVIERAADGRVEAIKYHVNQWVGGGPPGDMNPPVVHAYDESGRVTKVSEGESTTFTATWEGNAKVTFAHPNKRFQLQSAEFDEHGSLKSWVMYASVNPGRTDPASTIKASNEIEYDDRGNWTRIRTRWSGKDVDGIAFDRPFQEIVRTIVYREE